MTVSVLLKVTTYHVYMALQSECHVTVTQSRQHQLSPDMASPAQILTLRVDSINPAVTPFDIRCVCVRACKRARVCARYQVKTTCHVSTVSRLISSEYAELREKLHAPIRNSPNVVIHQTMSELFLETFRAHVDLNQPYTLPSGQVILLSVYLNSNHRITQLIQKHIFPPYIGGGAL